MRFIASRQITSFTKPGRSPHTAFTLAELLVVVGILGAMMALLVPAFNAFNRSSNLNNSAHEIAGILEQARSHAVAHGTYAWVGFFEEDASKAPGTAGIGRVVISATASNDGTMIYDPANPGPINPAKMTQLNKLMKLNNIHLKTASASDPSFPLGTGKGETFELRPAVASDGTAQIGDSTPPASPTPFQYPVGSNSAAQYTFTKVIQFSPRGEASIASVNPPSGSRYRLRSVIELGLQPTQGNIVTNNIKNVAAVQVTGMLGNVRIYRR